MKLFIAILMIVLMVGSATAIIPPSNIDMKSIYYLVNLPTPINNGDATTKSYVDSKTVYIYDNTNATALITSLNLVNETYVQNANTSVVNWVAAQNYNSSLYDLSQFNNDAGFITSYTETDPIYSSQRSYLQNESTAYKNANFTAQYDAISTRYSNENFTANIIATTNLINTETTDRINNDTANNESITAGLNTKLSLTGGTITGTLNVNGISNFYYPVYFYNTTYLTNLQALRVNNSILMQDITGAIVGNWTSTGAGVSNLWTLGNVGIGTTAPEGKLHIVGMVSAFPATSGTTQTGLVTRLAPSNSNAVLDVGVNAGNGAWLQVTNKSNLSWEYALLLNPNGGNVGIGTTVPNQKLDVNGVIQAYNGDGLSDPTVTMSAGMRFSLNSGTGGSNVYGLGLGAIDGTKYPMWFQTGSNNGGGFEWYIGTSEKMRISNTGNVGIGETSPGSKLSVLGGGAIGSTTAFSQASIASGNLAIEGNVGIGTATPAQTLSVVGSSNITGQVYLGGIIGTGNYVCYNATTGALFRNTTC